jgi:four helix bundle protein
MRNFRNWDVYNNSKKLTQTVYSLTQNFPDTEKFGLINQLRRSAVSIVANIAEGAGRKTENDFKHYLTMALGSSFEVEALFDISNDLNYIDEKDTENVMVELVIVQKQLNSFISKLK